MAENPIDEIRLLIHRHKQNNLGEPVVVVDADYRDRIEEECHLLFPSEPPGGGHFAELMGTKVYMDESVDGIVVKSEQQYTG